MKEAKDRLIELQAKVQQAENIYIKSVNEYNAATSAWSLKDGYSDVIKKLFDVTCVNFELYKSLKETYYDERDRHE
jgi:hypothetical protein